MGSFKGGTPSTTVTNNQPPQFVQDTYKSLINQGQNLVNTLPNPFPYTGQMVAPITQSAYDINQNILNSPAIANQWITQAAGLVGDAARYAPDLVNNYMSPYIQNVVDATQKQFDKSNAIQGNSLLGQAIRAGNAFGGDRAGLAQAELARNQQMAQAPVISGLYNQGYQSALQAAQVDMARQLQAAGVEGSLGLGQANQYMQSQQAGMPLYNLDQATQQALLNSQYQQYTLQQGFPYQQLGWLANIASGLGSGLGGTSNTQQTQGFNPLSSLLGLGMAGLIGFSDERLKENAEQIGETFTGEPIYRYNFKGSPRTEIGLMAQEADPDAVHEGPGGYKMLDYREATDDAARKGHFASGGAPGMFESGLLFGGLDFLTPKLQVKGGVGIPTAQVSGPKKDPNMEMVQNAMMKKGLGGLGKLFKGSGTEDLVEADTMPLEPLEEVVDLGGGGWNRGGGIYREDGGGLDDDISPPYLDFVRGQQEDLQANREIDRLLGHKDGGGVSGFSPAYAQFSRGLAEDSRANDEIGRMLGHKNGGPIGLGYQLAMGGGVGFADGGEPEDPDGVWPPLEGLAPEPNRGLGVPPDEGGVWPPLERSPEQRPPIPQEFGQPPPAPPRDPMQQWGRSIARIESGGDYGKVGPMILRGSYAGDRAYGKYQMMGKNIPEWTAQYLGQSMSPQQFLRSPEAQEAVFRGEFGRLAARYGPEGAARAWFAGPGGMNNPNARDQLGTSVADYGRRFTQGLGATEGEEGLGSALAMGPPDKPAIDTSGLPGEIRGGSADDTLAGGSDRLRTAQAASKSSLGPFNPFGLSDEARMGLIATGLGMMAGKSSNFFHNVGEGGLTGLSAYQSARKLSNEAMKLQQSINNQEEMRAQGWERIDESKRQHIERMKQFDATQKRLQQQHEESMSGVAHVYTGMGPDPNNPDQKVPGTYYINKRGQKTFEPEVVQRPAAPKTAQTPEQVAFEQFRANNPRITDAEALEWKQKWEQGVSKAKAEGRGQAVGETSLTGGALDIAADSYLKNGTFPPGLTRDTPGARQDRAAIMNRAEELRNERNITDVPSYRQKFKAQQIALQRFESGPQGNIIRSMNVVTDHVNTLLGLAKAMDNKDIQGYNRLANWWRQQTGSELPTNFDAARRIVGAEIIKALGVAGAGTESERAEAASLVSRASSPAQIEGAINTAVKPLLLGQLRGLRQQYTAATGRPASEFDNMLMPTVREYFGVDKEAGTETNNAPVERTYQGKTYRLKPGTDKNKKENWEVVN